MLKYRYNDYRLSLYTDRNFDETWISKNTSDSFTLFPEHEDDVMGVEGAAYKLLYRPVQAKCTKLKSVLSTLTVSLSV
jgi:hypothetical protein